MRPNNINSKYIYHPPGDPDTKQIDDRIFFCDANISQMEVVKKYEEFVANEDYDSALNILHTTNVDYYGPYVLNLLENRLVALGRHFMNMDGDGRVKSHLQHLSSTEPTSAEITMSDNYSAWEDDRTQPVTTAELEAGKRYYHWISE